MLNGGSTNSEGNVFAKNPVTGIFGPVCDDGFDANAVSFEMPLLFYRFLDK